MLNVYHHLLLFVFIAAAFTFVSVSLVRAPYGRFVRSGWGVSMNNRFAWMLMESPAVLVFAVFFFMGSKAQNAFSLFFFLLWQWHYLYRTFIFPFLLRGQSKVMPVAIVGMALVFNCANAFINAYWLGHLANYTSSLLYSAHFIVGVTLFSLGFLVHFFSDQIVIHLRKPNETDYKIPHRFMYRWVCSPNYLGEIIEWVGFALATYSLPALAFALYTMANLVPRAKHHLKWYRSTFSHYPVSRRALIPYLF